MTPERENSFNKIFSAQLYQRKGFKISVREKFLKIALKDKD
jgi:hypothetical protein